MWCRVRELNLGHSEAFPQSVCSSSTVSSLSYNLEVLIFVEGGKPENPEKNPRSEDENQQETQPTCDTGSRNRTRVTAVGGECSYHYTIPAPPSIMSLFEDFDGCS